MTSIEVRESEIEDIFVHYPVLLRRILGVSRDIFLVARQKTLPSGRLDLVYSHGSDLLLVELKVEPFKKPFIKQVLDYKTDLICLQQMGEFIKGDVNAILLCPDVTRGDKQIAKEEDVNAVSYRPEEALLEFYRSAPLDTRYLTVQPSDHGVWRIGLVNESLSLVERYPQIQQIAAQLGKSPRTIGNQFRFAKGLGLIQRESHEIYLTPSGKQFVDARDAVMPPNMISQNQASVIRKLILTAPFFSGVTFGILTMVGCIFELSRNTYPVPLGLVSRHFLSAAGLHYRWDTEKAAHKGIRMYTNYAIDLGMIGKVGNNYFVTPSGFNFVLLLNMNRSLKLIENTTRIE